MYDIYDSSLCYFMRDQLPSISEIRSMVKTSI